jgi:dTDP-4-amino-4,6-dideoxygalactose transaminase
MTREASDMVHAPDGPWYYEQIDLGYNYRITDIQAALGSAQLRRLPQMHAAREASVARYDTLLAHLPIKLPARQPDRRSSWHLYAIEIDARHTGVSRREVFERLRASGIGVNVHYIPIHTQPYYRALGFRPGDFPAAEAYYAAAISLPLFPAMTEQQQDRVAYSLAQALHA